MSDVRWVDTAPMELRAAVTRDRPTVIDLRGSDAVVVLDGAGLLIGADDEAGRLLGSTADSLLVTAPSRGEWTMCRADGEVLPEQETPTAVALRTGEPVLEQVLGVESRDEHDVRSFAWVEVAAYPLHDDAGSLAGTAMRLRDVSDSPLGRAATASMVRSFRALSKASREDEARFRVLAENSADVVFQSDIAGRCVWVSPSVTDVLGWTSDAIIGRPLAPLLHPDDRELANERRRTALAEGEGGHSRLELRYSTVAGHWRWMSVLSRPLRDTTGRVVGGLTALRDIQDEVERREEMRYLSVHDSLTGLVNRDAAMHALVRALEKAQAAGTWVGVLYIDVDHFKDINDTFGHATGDRVLVEVGHRLTAILRDTDLVARLGGDEFLAILNSVREPGNAERRARSLLDAVSAPGEGGLPATTVSIGLVTDDGSGEAGKVLRDADAALYRAKQAGRNRLSR